jgi:hypothetical protein
MILQTYRKAEIRIRIIPRTPVTLAEVGKITLKNNGDETFIDESLSKSNSDEEKI